MQRILIMGVMLAACHGTPGVECEGGSLCPDGTTCRVVAEVERCVTEAQLAQCTGRADRESCEVSTGVPGLCNQQVCLRAGCGDGFVSGTEQCDGADLDGRRDCRDIGYYGEGELGCSVDCTFDQTGCSNLGKCGDGIINNTEQCDGADLDDKNCTTAGGFYAPDGLACNDACRFDFTTCTGFCGDGILDDVEECDAVAGGAPVFAVDFDNCNDLDYYRDVPISICNSNCRVARTECDATAGFCGDDVADLAAGEQCDDLDLGLIDLTGDDVIDCQDLDALPGRPYYQGDLACRTNCGLDTSACRGFCGDGEVNGTEVCDRLDLGGEGCGAYGGNLGCNASCTGTTGGCFGFYGDGEINGNERCDGLNFGGQTCANYGYNDLGTGNLICDEGAIDAATCTFNGYCGDGTVQEGEQCDGADVAGTDCTSTLGAGPLDCNERCQFATGTCQNSFWSRHAIPLPPGMPAVELVDGYSPTTSSLWVVSRHQLAWQWDGTRWISRNLPSAIESVAIAGVGDVIWVATRSGDVYRWDWIGPTSGMWVEETTLPQIFDLYSDGETLFAATRDGVYARANGSWLQAATGFYVTIDGRDGIVMAGGPYLSGSNVARRERDGTWTKVALAFRDVQTPPTVTTISVISRDEAIVTRGIIAGDEVRPESETASYWNGLEAWSLSLGPVAPGMIVADAFGATGDDIWILTTVSTGLGSRPALFHHTGFGAQLGPNIEPFYPPLTANSPRGARLIGSDPGNLWVLGDGAVVHYEGPGWYTPPMRELRNLDFPNPNAFSLDTTTLQRINFTVATSRGAATWFAGSETTTNQTHVFEHRDEGIAFANGVPRPLGHLSFDGLIDAMAIDDQGWVWAASGQTVRAIANTKGLAGPVPAPGLLPEPATAAWSTGSQVVFGTLTRFGQPARIVVHGPAGWRTLTVECPTCVIGGLDSVDAIGGTSASDIWIAGRGAIARWNGDVQNPIWQIDGDGGIGEPLRAMWVASAHEAWLVHGSDPQPSTITQIIWPDGDSPIAHPIVRSDGVALGTLRSVWGGSSQDVWFVGDAAEALHWDGARLGALPLPNGGANAITGTYAQDVWAVGAGGVARISQRLPSTTGGACGEAIPVFCGAQPVTVQGTVGTKPVVYRLVSPMPGGAASATAVAKVTAFSGSVDLDVLEARAQAAQPANTPSVCEPRFGPPGPPTTMETTPLTRGAWKYFVVAPVGSPDATYQFELACTLE